MSQEHAPNYSPHSPETDPYKIAFAIGDLLLEHLQAQGKMMRTSEIEDELELEEHFDQLNRLYRQVCLSMGLTWPPPEQKPAAEVDITL